MSFLHPLARGIVSTGKPGLVILSALAVALVGCGGYSGPPDLETAKVDLPPEYLIAYDGMPGRTVLELLEEAADSVETEGYGEELLVVAINGIANGTDERYWLYYVNGRPGQVSANSRETVAGDRIEWIFHHGMG